MKSSCAILSACMVCLLAPWSVQAASEMDSPQYAFLLKAVVNQQGMVDYLKLTQNLYSELDQVCSAYAGVEASTFDYWSNEEQMAFLLNAYNLYTLKVIADHYPVTGQSHVDREYPANSIQQIEGAWKGILFTLLERPISLDGIEHQMIREWYDDPRIHMALVCAARGCPSLLDEPYNAKKLNQQLDQQSRRFLARKDVLVIDTERRRVKTSPLFDWYRNDFKATEKAPLGVHRSLQGVAEFLAIYAPPESQPFLKDGNYKIRWLRYDWSLNEIPTP